MVTGPDKPDTSAQEGTKTVRIIGFSILACSECERDCLFALVQMESSQQQFQFCTGCGRYFEEGGEPNGSH